MLGISGEKKEKELMERDFYIDKNKGRHDACNDGEDIYDDEQRDNEIHAPVQDVVLWKLVNERSTFEAVECQHVSCLNSGRKVTSMHTARELITDDFVNNCCVQSISPIQLEMSCTNDSGQVAERPYYICF